MLLSKMSENRSVTHSQFQATENLKTEIMRTFVLHPTRCLEVGDSRCQGLDFYLCHFLAFTVVKWPPQLQISTLYITVTTRRKQGSRIDLALCTAFHLLERKSSFQKPSPQTSLLFQQQRKLTKKISIVVFSFYFGRYTRERKIGHVCGWPA